LPGGHYIDPLADLAGAIALETHPDFDGAKAPRLFKAMHVVLIALFSVIKFIGEIRRFDSK